MTADTVSGSEPFYCPLQEGAEVVLDVAEALARAMRRLRRLRLHCAVCAQSNACPFWEQFNRQVDQAIREINHEWGLG